MPRLARIASFVPLLLLSSLWLAAQTAPPGPTTNSSVVDAQGTAHITRVVPLPSVLAPETLKAYQHPGSDAASMDPDVLKRRAATQVWQDGAAQQSLAVYPARITESKVAGIPVHLVDPLPEAKAGPASMPGVSCDPLHYSAIAASQGGQQADGLCSGKPEPIHADRVLLCLHGGGFNSDSGSYSESIPMANLTRTRVVSVLYRLSPENQYPAALEDAIAVYRELLKTYAPRHIVIYGTSAGAILTGEVAARIKQLGLPQPAALGVFSGLGDFAARGDSGALFTLTGFTGQLPTPKLEPGPQTPSEYYGMHDPHDPILSPNGGDLHGLPPTLFLTSSRDMLMSGTADMERAWRRDGVRTQMVVFDGLPHAFWLNVNLAESREAFAVMAAFFATELGR
ncbi:MAG TPA: alpha/beta hydrolase fold domain-containing protein [Acidobacteriaceae bacterium]